MEKEIQWSAPEFEYHHKGHAWYWMLAIVSIILIFVALLQKNFLFAIFVLMAAILSFTMARHTPQYLNFLLNDSGIRIGDQKHYPFDSLSGFATHRVDDLEDGLTEIVFAKKHRVSTHLKILAPTNRIEEIKLFLNKHLPEIEYEESLTDHISRFLKF